MDVMLIESWTKRGKGILATVGQKDARRYLKRLQTKNRVWFPPVESVKGTKVV